MLTPKAPPRISTVLHECSSSHTPSPSVPFPWCRRVGTQEEGILGPDSGPPLYSIFTPLTGPRGQFELTISLAHSNPARTFSQSMWQGTLGTWNSWTRTAGNPTLEHMGRTFHCPGPEARKQRPGTLEKPLGAQGEKAMRSVQIPYLLSVTCLRRGMLLASLCTAIWLWKSLFLVPLFIL